jgi:hypothetical protein
MVAYIFVDIVKKQYIAKYNILSTIKININTMRFIKIPQKNLIKGKKSQSKINSKILNKLSESSQDHKIMILFFYNKRKLNKIKKIK